jgi:hypothetical protein
MLPSGESAAPGLAENGQLGQCCGRRKTNGIFGRSLVFSTSILAYPNFLTHMITNGNFEFQPIDWTMLSYYICMADCIRTQILQFLKNQNLM